MESALIPDNDLGFLLNDVSRLFRQMFERAVDEAGLELTSGEVRTLAYVASLSHCRQNVIADRMGIEPMTLSVYLDRLEVRGLVARMPDSTDRRAKIVAVTDKAETFFLQARPIALAVFRRATFGISEADLLCVEAVLSQILSNMGADTASAASRRHSIALAQPIDRVERGARSQAV